MHRSCINHSAVININDIDEKFKVLKNAGFECIDFNIDEFLSGAEINSGEFNELFNSDIQAILEFFKPYKEAAEKYGVEIHQAHAPFQLYVDGRDDINEKCYEMLEKSMAICEYLSCHYLVVHPLNLMISRGREYEISENIEYYKRLIPFAKKYKTVICLENMFSVINRHATEAVCSDCYEAANYIDTLNEMAGEEIFGFCFDLGHMNLLGKYIPQSLRVLGKRVKLLHIHDNDGIMDNHGVPYSFARWMREPVTDWKGFLEGLKDINYQGEFDFECSTGCNIVPIELLPARLTLVSAMGRYFAEVLKK